MDLRTGRTYPTKQAAIDAGVPEADIMLLAKSGLPRDAKRSKYKAPHQGKREIERRRRLAAK
jgi:hypothetical protein